MVLKKVLYVPEFKINLLSQGQLVEKGVEISAKKEGCTLYYQNKVLTKGLYRNNLTLIYTQVAEPAEKAYISTSEVNWHQRMGHIGLNALEALSKATEGCEIAPQGLIKCKECETCIKAKATIRNSRRTPERASDYLEKVHSDICGPISPETWTKKRYFTSFIDDKTRFVDIALLRTKDQVYDEYVAWQTREQRQSGLKVKKFHSDNAREYRSKDFQDLHRLQGVIGTQSAPYTPAQNGVSERYNRTVIEKARAMLLEAKLPKAYWGEAVTAATYLYNRTPNSSIGYLTPYEAKTGLKPDISSIRIWGSVAYRVMPEIGRKKLDARAKPYILIGYGSNQYKLLELATRKTIWVRDAYILEGKFQSDISENNQELVITSEQSAEESDQPKVDADQLVEEQLALENPQPVVQPQEIELPQIQPDQPARNQETSTYDDFISQLNQYADLDVEMETALPTINGPSTYREALESPEASKWKQAMEIELEELKRQNTWDLVPLPTGRQAIPGRWVNVVKETTDGPVYKSRWVAKGFRQQAGLDFNETYANTVNPVVYRFILAFTALYDWEVHQWDVKSAFPNASIKEEIYVKQPTGQEVKGSEQLVCRLNKALYGLKQSAREWEITFRGMVSKIGLEPLKIDQSVYQSTIGTPIILITHVDDILAISPNKRRIQEVYNQLNSMVNLKDLGEAKTFLGIEIERDRPKRSLTLHQGTYTSKILEKYRPNLKTESAIPASIGHKIGPYEEIQKPEVISQYQQEIGSILYLTTKTRPDIAYITGLLSRFMANPGPEHFQALEKLWKYLAKYPKLGLNYHSEPELLGYCDSDWGGDIGTRRSTTGYIYLFRGSPIAWSSKLQKTVALSSCEAEYMALKEAIKEQQYITAISTSIAFFRGLEHPETLYTDSLSAIQLAKNPGHHHRTKHIDIQYHYVRQKVQEGKTNLIHIHTSEQPADYLTKAMPIPKWAGFIDAIGLKRL